MRIVAGRHRGRVLQAPPGSATRPTADRARQALFDMLAHAPWSPFAGRLALKARAHAAPLRFMGQNSRLFQIASHIHPALRLALFFHELRRRIGAPVEARIGPVMSPVSFEGLDAEAVTARLRAACDALARD